MNRQGLFPDEVADALRIIHSSKIILDGICSHFSDADGSDTSFTKEQIRVWNDLVGLIHKGFPGITYFHTSATAGHAFEGEVGTRSIDSNITRLGIGLYGIHPNMTPVLNVETVLSDVKEVKKGASVGYARTFVAQTDMTIATVPAGYYEGIDRRLSNVGALRVLGQDAPIVGRVSMNITTIDVSRIAEADRGVRVTLISNHPGDMNSVENIAKICETIPYEIFVHIPAHLKRVIVK